MTNHLEALRQNIIADTVAEYTDFVFTLTTDPKGNLIIDYHGKWQSHRNPMHTDIPYMTIQHDGDRFLVSHYRWDENRPYKTVKGAAKYINAELRRSCDNVRKQKEKEDQEKAFAEKSARILQEFHDTITEKGIEAKLYSGYGYQQSSLSIEAKRLNTRIDITVTSDYRLQIYFPYPRCYTSTETAIDILSALSQKGSA
ncbi:MAG: hypothetical protein LUE17_17420 [Planctomycetaceae bacterium]|nr:hypothetical protein [Planctomycetaceae bacterium]